MNTFGRISSALFAKAFPPIIFILAGLGLYLSSRYHYLLFHALVELLSVAVAFALFMLAWNSRQFSKNMYLVFLGIAYLFVGSLDFVHTLSYKGMNIFLGYDANLPTQLWIAARYLESCSLPAALFFLKRTLHAEKAFAVYSIIFTSILAAVLTGVFPVCYREGVGLSPFKIVSEYIISLILLCGLILLYRQRREFATSLFRLMVVSVFLTICSELAFTSYIGVYDLSNMVGHYLKLISFYLLYKAVVEVGLRKPYQALFNDLQSERDRLLQSRTMLLQAQQTAKIGSWSYALQARMFTCSVEISRIFGLEAAGPLLPYHTFSQLIHPDDRDRFERAFRCAVIEGQGDALDLKIIRSDGEIRDVAVTCEAQQNTTGAVFRLIGIMQDISERKQAEKQIQASLEEKKVLMQEILHRTKNNMASIISLLHLQAYRMNDKRIEQSFEEIEHRVRAMLLVQQKLYQSSDFTHLDLKEYFTALASSVFNNFYVNSARVALLLEFDSITVEPDIAIPFGLLLNELITNALKYAFPEGREGELRITLHASQKREIVLSVRDTGVGLPEKFNLNSIDSLGVQLIKSFVEQISGTIECIRPTQGTEFIIRCPAPKMR